jgi:hypothetical protein
METRKWKVFLRLKGETIVDTDQDLLTEFKVMVEYLKWIGVDYSMAIQVEAGRAEHARTVAWSRLPAGEDAEQLGD